ncbi:hypothetical protein VTN02DRAFT_2244 [Thermoascus thermophilus]
MSDTDQEWKPNGRPQSTMAQAFSLALDSAFKLDSDADHLSQTVDQKKQMVMIQSRELEVLQAKIREAEERLRKARGASGGDGAHQRDGSEGPTDTSASAATSNDLEERLHGLQQEHKGKARAS